jgi:hypothetical protein
MQIFFMALNANALPVTPTLPNPHTRVESVSRWLLMLTRSP